MVGGVMEKKFLKLAVLGIIVFVVLLGVFMVIFPNRGPVGVKSGESLTIEPYFVKQFLEENPGFKSSVKGKLELLKANRKIVVLSEMGFPTNTEVFDVSLSEGAAEKLQGLASLAVLKVSNNSSKVKSFVVFSKGMDGIDYKVSEFVLGAGDRVDLSVIVGPYLNEILESSEVKVERTELGIPLFKIACNFNCSEENKFLEVYARLS